MKAVRVHEFGGPEAMRYEDVPQPQAGAGQVVLKIDAAGVNFIDVYHRTGRYPLPLPRTLGREAAGTVVAVGADVAALKVGDRVAGADFAGGAYAEYAAVPARRLVRVPAGIAARDAAALMLQGMTAHYLTASTCPLAPGDACLVHAAAGGVGRLLCQIAKLRGARVIATVGTDEKAEIARSVGADEVIVYTRTDFAAEVARLTGGAGVRVVYDGVGKATFDKGLDCLARRGMMVLYGMASGPVPPVDTRTLNVKGSLFLTRPTLAHYSADGAELDGRARELFAWVEQGKLRLHIDCELPLAQAADAHRRLEARASIGKLLLLP